jgi:hypothetical protein
MSRRARTRAAAIAAKHYSPWPEPDFEPDDYETFDDSRPDPEASQPTNAERMTHQQEQQPCQ